ncbi:hypothetical protein KSP39_PZI016995 [Platanthera zijinensis]|uniref:Calmodulin-binding protein n=1 Tax=Platanthera zijinensis TaxID=2320716 RepID=A0AAP0B905_9ASPA
MAPAMSRSPDFRLDCSVTAPSSPRMFGEPFDYQFHYTSTPTSPTRAAAIYSHFSSFDNDASGEVFDFAFDSGRISTSLALTEISSAEELFDNGKIRPLQPAAPATDRGRQMSSVTSSAGNRGRGARSLSPLRDHRAYNKNTASTTAPALPKSGSGSRKWRLKDLLLFRSASEGRATSRESRDPLRKYALFPSFFSSSSTSKRKLAGGSDDSRSCGGSVRRGGGPVASAHEIHYTANRAAAEEQRKKTAMAYQRQGLFGFIQYNPAIRSITKGFNGYASKTS